jgi:hypothetical protein
MSYWNINFQFENSLLKFLSTHYAKFIVFSSSFTRIFLSGHIGYSWPFDFFGFYQYKMFKPSVFHHALNIGLRNNFRTASDGYFKTHS